MDVSVVISTYGGEEWQELAAKRAVPSALTQVSSHRVVVTHCDTLQEARQAGLEHVESEWVVHLDADDRLERGYVEAVGKVAEEQDADIVAPAVRTPVTSARWGHATVPRVVREERHTHICEGDCLPEGNWIIVGALARTNVLLQAGGWLDEPIWEDWSLWLRAWACGASFARAPRAVYRAYEVEASRNKGLDIHDDKPYWREVIVQEAVRRGVDGRELELSYALSAI